ncbi:MAG: hypothetical protein K2X87_29130 [Gemmataceae bacterium]|nr:hypothetical protein [Gemmataceae bacterium]
MILTNLRAALTGPNPPAALAAVVRNELDAGRSPAEVADALADLLPSVRELPGYTDDWEEHLVTLADRLTGWAHPAAQLHPTAEG